MILIAKRISNLLWQHGTSYPHGYFLKARLKMARLLTGIKLQLQKSIQFGILVRTDIQHITQRYVSQGGTGSIASKTTATARAKGPTDVPGLSSAVYKLPSSEVGPGASKTGEYKNPEYFCYNRTSYFEAEIEMLKYRLPQPSSKSPKN